MKITAEKLNELSAKRKDEIIKERNLEELNKQKEEEERINSILKKVYDYFESNWLKKAEKEAKKGYNTFEVRLEEKPRNPDCSYDVSEVCHIITGVYLSDLYKILKKEGLNYFNTLCKHIEEQGFKDVKVICDEYSWRTIQLNHCVSYTICLQAAF